MTPRKRRALGAGPLTVRGVIEDAIGMLRQSFVRIALVALVFFALPAVLAGIVVELISLFVGNEEPLIVVAAVGSLFAAATLRILGPVAFAGFLDEAVAKEYLRGDHTTLRQVMRNLPWKSLIGADVVVMLVVGIGLSLLVLPGLFLYGLLGLAGPVVVQERMGIRASLRRAAQLAQRSPGLVTILVVLPFAFEELLHSVIFQTVHDYGIGVEVLVEWIVAIAVGGTLGLLEVALASELMARHPRTANRNPATDAAPLLDDGPAPAV